MNNKLSGVKPIQSIERMYKILDCFKRNKELGLTDISKLTGLHKSTTSGIVSTLKSLQFLEQNETTGKYSLGMEIFRLYAHANFSEKNLFEPYLKNLYKKTNETIILHSFTGSIMENHSTTVVDFLESTHNIKFLTHLGSEILLNCSAVGKSMLALLKDTDLDYILQSIPLQAMSQSSITDISVLKKEIQEIRQIGYGISMGETENGAVGVGIAIPNKYGKPIYGIGIACPSFRIDDNLLKEYGELLLAEKSKIINDLVFG